MFVYPNVAGRSFTSLKENEVQLSPRGLDLSPGRAGGTGVG